METKKFTHIFRNKEKIGSYRTRTVVGRDSEPTEGFFDKVQIKEFLKTLATVRLKIEYGNFSWTYDLEEKTAKVSHGIGLTYEQPIPTREEIEEGMRLSAIDFFEGEGLYLFIEHY